jgi:galactokinase
MVWWWCLTSTYPPEASVVPERTYRAPGRVNLIGDHTDYNEGFVLPLAIDLDCVVRGRLREDDRVVVRSLDRDGEVDIAADGTTEPTTVDPPWGRYVAGVVRTLAERGRAAAGLDATITSTIPLSAGLSSSAALEVAVGLALCDAAQFELPLLELARACQEAELVATGVPCGIMDQLASLAGSRNRALLIDCRSFEIEHIPLPPRLAVIVIDSGMPRQLVDSAYAERRRACELAAARLGVPSLRDATPEQVADDPRARHVVSENVRVLAAAEALATDDLARLGRLLAESHASLRDDFEVSTPELDVLVEKLVEAGALGARLTGAGFGGCVVGLASRDQAAAVVEAAAGRYWAETGHQPRAFVCQAVEGAGRVE